MLKGSKLGYLKNDDLFVTHASGGPFGAFKGLSVVDEDGLRTSFAPEVSCGDSGVLYGSRVGERVEVYKD